MKKVLMGVISVVLVVCVFGGLFFYKYQVTKTYYNEGDVNGNTIGNLYGNGLYCEKNGKVYFANPLDGNSLYVMNPDETEVTKLANDRIYFINADDHYLYYSRDNNVDNSQMGFLGVNTDSLCRITQDGKRTIILDDAICEECSLCGNTVYYLHFDSEEASTLYKVDIDGENKEQLNNTAIDPRCMVGPKLYYSGVVSDHSLRVINVKLDTNSFVSEESTWFPTVEGDYVYFMDLDDGDRINRMSISTREKTRISNFGISNYNLSGNYIYYQSKKGNPDGLYRIDLSSGEEVLMAEGEYNNINVTSKYVYFSDFFSGRTYHAKNGSLDYSIFSPAIEVTEE